MSEVELKAALRAIARLTAPERGKYRHPPTAKCHDIATAAIKIIDDRDQQLVKEAARNMRNICSIGAEWAKAPDYLRAHWSEEAEMMATRLEGLAERMGGK